MAPPDPDTFAEYLYRSLLSRNPAVNRVRRLDMDARRRSERRGALPPVRDPFRGRLPTSHKVIHRIIDFVARDDPNSLPACALVSRQWNSRAAYHLKILFYDRFSICRLPIKLIHRIIDFVARDDPDSLPACALLSHQWNSRATYHLKIMFYHWSPISRLPIELIQNIIGFIAQHGSSSLYSCTFVSRRWRVCASYHLQRLTKPYHHVQITAISTLHAVVDVIKKDSYLAQYPKSLNISPDPEALSTSYIPFLDLSSRSLPNVNRLILGEGLRWTDYPPLYNNGTVGSPFHSVTILDLYCRFKSPQSLFRAVRSFRNLEEVRLHHPDPFFGVQPITATENMPRGALAPVRLRKPLRSLEVSVSPRSLCFP